MTKPNVLKVDLKKIHRKTAMYKSLRKYPIYINHEHLSHFI